ncbi:peptidoglycan-binding protein [Pontibacter sp. SGAir0037]|nr:peptidoglycan-binding protein [Pontibacter sp. SGAir0037]
MPAVRDSVGVERKNGKLFVQHRVEPKETLYALSRKYSVPVSQIVEANPKVESTIAIGQIVLIPRQEKATRAAAPAKASPAAVATDAPASSRTFTVNDKGDKLHVVEPKQTLYAISRMHHVSVEDIKKWNNLSSDQVNIGSSLVVGKGGATASKKPLYIPEPDDSMVEDKTIETATASVETASTATPVTTVSTPAQPVVNTARADEDEEAGSGMRRVMESGMAEVIDPKSDTNKYLALHKSAPVGTIMQVKNMMNGQVVYVRVIGKLPDTGANDKVVVRISKKACQKLGVVDQKFRVELSYMPS